MKNTWIKHGSFRGVLLQAIADGSIYTVDDLQDKLGEQRRKIQDNIMHAANEGFCKRLRDDVTNLPAYQITKEGRNYIALETTVAATACEPPQIEAADQVIFETPTPVSEFDGGIEMDHTRLLPTPPAAEVAVQPDQPASPERFLIVSQAGRVFSNSEEVICLASAKSQALKAAKEEGIHFKVFRVELVGFAYPPSAATWQNA